MNHKTIVVADDAGHVRARFAEVLEGAGHEVVTVQHAADLVSMVRSTTSSPDLVLLDLHLPGATGVELIETIRREPAGGMPIVVFAGSVLKAPEVRRLADLGVAGYVNEHCDRQQILRAIAPHLFPDNFNRRGSDRAALDIPVALRRGERILAAMSLDVGKGGVGVRTMTPLEVSEKVVARFRLPGCDRDVEAESNVAWSDRLVGMGLQFERIAPADQLLIDDFVDRR